MQFVSDGSCFTYLYRRLIYYSKGYEGDINEVKKKQENEMKKNVKQEKEKDKDKGEDNSGSEDENAINNSPDENNKEKINEGEVNSGDESDEDREKGLNNKKANEEEKANENVEPSINPLILCHCKQYMKPNAFDKVTLKEQKITFECQFTEECKEKAEYLNDLCNHYYCKKCIEKTMHDRKKNEPMKCPLDEKPITPTICLDVDIEKALKIYGKCRLNKENCTYLPECVNNCECAYCRECVKMGNIDCPCGGSNTRTEELQKQIRNLVEKEEEAKNSSEAKKKT